MQKVSEQIPTTADMETYIKSLLDYAEKRWPSRPDLWRQFAEDGIRNRVLMDEIEDAYGKI